MGSSFKDREKGFENKFAHDQEMQFKAIARGTRIAGLWAAGILGKSGDDANAYATDVVKSDFAEAGQEDVVRKLAADLAGKVDEASIRTKLAECVAIAKEQLASEG